MANKLPPSHRPRGPEHGVKIKNGVQKREEFSAIGDEVVEVDGVRASHREHVARKLWNAAHGYVEKVRDEFGTVQEIPHPWSLQAAKEVLDRDMGKPAASDVKPEDTKPITASEKIDELLIQKLNLMAVEAVGDRSHA